MVAFRKHAYGRARDADKFLMSQQPALKYTWNTLVADFVVLGYVLGHSMCGHGRRGPEPHHPSRQHSTVVAQQPHPDPNYAPYAAARLLAVA